MNIQELFDQELPSDLAKLSALYATRCVDHAELAPHPSLPLLIAKLDERKKETRAERATILCALIDLHRSSHDRLWSSILLRAFRPMVIKVCNKLRGAARDERMALLLSTFLEVLLRVDTTRDPARIAMYVRQQTRRAVFRELREERDWRPVGFGQDADLVADPSTVEEPLLRGIWVRGQKAPDGERIELLGTLTDRGALWCLVRNRYGLFTAKQQARIYRRLQDRRRRLVARLRGRLKREVAPTSHGIQPVTRDTTRVSRVTARARVTRDCNASRSRDISASRAAEVQP